MTAPATQSTRKPDRLRALHAALAMLCIGFMALLVAATLISGCNLTWLLRPELVAWLAAALVLAGVLFSASRADDDRRRLTGSIASGAMTGLMLGTLSLPVLVVPLSLIGCFRLPRSSSARVELAVLAPTAAAIAVALPFVARALSTASQTGCP